MTAVLESHHTTTPETFTLSQNYPNPFIPKPRSASTCNRNRSNWRSTTWRRRESRRWCHREAGSYSVRWDGVTDTGLELASGVYFYRLKAGERVETRKLLLLR